MELRESPWVTDGGLETDLIFNHGVDLPEFASFPLLEDESGATLLRAYYREYAAIALSAGVGLLLETPTWRANRDWGAALGYNAAALNRLNQAAPAAVRDAVIGSGVGSLLVSGCVGPRGDGYRAAVADPDEAAEYHLPQIRALADGGADLVHAMTLTGTGEALGVVAAAREVQIPVAISFTVETDGRLPDGTSLSDALASMEAGAPADHYGINCAHPVHVREALDGGEWQDRITFFRPNASTMSHAELDAADELDAGDVGLLTSASSDLLADLGGVAVLGGCCGTDSRHVGALWGIGAA